MANDLYTKELKKIMTDETPAEPTTRSREELEVAIAGISKRLAGPLSNVDRLWWIEERQALRKQLAALG